MPLLKGWETRETRKDYFDKLSWIHKVGLTLLSQALLRLLTFFFFFNCKFRNLHFAKLSLYINPQGLQNKCKPDVLDSFAFN